MEWQNQESRFNSRHEARDVLPIPQMSRLALGLTKPPIYGVRGVVTLGAERPGREAVSCGSKVKNEWRYTYTTSICFRGVYVGTFLPVMLFSSPIRLCVLLLSWVIVPKKE